MSSPQEGKYTPSRRDLFRPVELLGLSAVVAVVVGVVVFASTRTFEVAIIFAGLTFIVTLVVLAMLALTAKPDGDEQTDLREQDRDRGPTH